MKESECTVIVKFEIYFTQRLCQPTYVVPTVFCSLNFICNKLIWLRHKQCYFSNCMQVKVHNRQHQVRKGRRSYGTKVFQFYFRQFSVIRNNGMKEEKKKKECEHYFKPNLLNFIVKVCLEFKKKIPSQYEGWNSRFFLDLLSSQ